MVKIIAVTCRVQSYKPIQSQSTIVTFYFNSSPLKHLEHTVATSNFQQNVLDDESCYSTQKLSANGLCVTGMHIMVNPQDKQVPAYHLMHIVQLGECVGLRHWNAPSTCRHEDTVKYKSVRNSLPTVKTCLISKSTHTLHHMQR